MKRNKFALRVAAFCLIVMSFIACDKDYTTIESDIINNQNATNFDILSEQYDIISYTEALGPVQTDNLGLNTLGVYDDIYGRTISSFVTQVTLGSFDPDFGDEVMIDSVVLTIPYFSVATDLDEDNNISYALDSVFPKGDTYESIKLSLFESNYFIRDFDPNAEFNDSQVYFSNKTASTSEIISDAALEAEPIGFVDYNEVTGNFDPISNILDINANGHVLTDINELDDNGDPQVLQRLTPGIRILLDPTYFQEKIIDKEGDPVLGSQNSFSDYFRGLYFKAEVNDNDNGSFLILNTGSQNSNITIYYSRLTPSETDDATETDQSNFVLTFRPNRINFMDNDFVAPIDNGDPSTGNSRIYLKGGEGSIGRIKLFNGDDVGSTDDMTFEDWKNFFVDTEDDKFVKSKRLVNEANLVFYVDQNIMQDDEPNRLYLYDIENKTPLIDYFLDRTNNSIPSFSRINHLGPLQRIDDDPNGNGIKYKLRITEHINNLLLRDSTNIELGLAVSLNVNLEETFLQRKVQTADNSDFTLPISSIITPKGTVLHGNTTEDESKKVYLEIYYTEPNN
jgi:hypothetical protein